MALPIGQRALGVLRQLRRDLGMLTGERPPPFVSRTAPARADTTTALAPRRLVVREIVRETSDAVTLCLADPGGRPIPFVAGQFFTLFVPVGGAVLRRAYSASSSPRDPSRVAVTVKRVAGGRASSYLVDTARVGDAIDVLGPSGSFTLPSETPRALVLVAGGSGITPLMAILREALETAPATRVALLYGSRAPEDVIFASAIDALSGAHAERCEVRHVFGPMLDAAALTAALDALTAPREPDARFFVCGPEPMMHLVRAVLEARGVGGARVHEERFVSPHLRPAERRANGAASHVTVRIGGVETRVVVDAGRTLLEAGLASGAKMPYSCAMGGCGACRVKVCAGAVEMEEPNCLSDAERRDGYALACVGCPTDGAVVEVA